DLFSSSITPAKVHRRQLFRSDANLIKRLQSHPLPEYSRRCALEAPGRSDNRQRRGLGSQAVAAREVFQPAREIVILEKRPAFKTAHHLKNLAPHPDSAVAVVDTLTPLNARDAFKNPGPQRADRSTPLKSTLLKSTPLEA